MNITKLHEKDDDDFRFWQTGEDLPKALQLKNIYNARQNVFETSSSMYSWAHNLDKFLGSKKKKKKRKIGPRG